MTAHMKSRFCRRALAVGLAVSLVGCGNRETREALQKATTLADQKQYQDANDVLVEALRTREGELRARLPAPADDGPAVDDLTKKVQADSEILKLERAQIPLYLHLQRPDLASAVYSDILAGDPEDTVVYDSLEDKDPAMRTGAVRVLGLTGQTSAIDALAKATHDSDQDVRRAAVAALGAIKDPATVPPLIDALKDTYWFARSDAADALGREHDPRAIKPLLNVVADSDATVESSAENALVLLASQKGAPGDDFAARLNDPNPKIVTISAVCLAVEKDARATPVLLKMAASPDAHMRLHAVKALGESGDPAVLPTLRQLLQDPDINVRGWSIIGLGKLGDKDSVPALQAIAADTTQSPNIRNAAVAAVAHITGAPLPPEDAGAQ
jgi:HEAT repeat protein